MCGRKVEYVTLRLQSNLEIGMEIAYCSFKSNSTSYTPYNYKSFPSQNYINELQLPTDVTVKFFIFFFKFYANLHKLNNNSRN